MSNKSKASWLNNLPLLPDIRDALITAREQKSQKAKSTCKARSRQAFVNSLSSLANQRFSQQEIDESLEILCKGFLDEMENQGFYRSEINTAKILLNWAKQKPVLLPSLQPNPYLSVYENGKRVITFSASFDPRWDVEIVFRFNKDADYLLKGGLKASRAVVSDLVLIGVTKVLDPSGRETILYGDIPKVDNFCKVLDQIVAGVSTETYQSIRSSAKSSLVKLELELEDEFEPKDSLELEDKIDPTEFDFTSLEDAREFTNRAIALRQGQGQFRRDLIRTYKKCVITGCDAEEALEAAHIHPYKGEHTNTLKNGLLLRGDIHTLFDRYLITINPKTYRVKIAPSLLNTTYCKLEKKEITDIQTRVSEDLLRFHFEEALRQWGND